MRAHPGCLPKEAFRAVGVDTPAVSGIGFTPFCVCLLPTGSPNSLDFYLFGSMSERTATSPQKDTGLFGRSLTPNDEGAPDFVVAVHHFLIQNGTRLPSLFIISSGVPILITTYYYILTCIFTSFSNAH